MSKLNYEYQKAKKNVKMFGGLQKCRNLDFPQNLNYIYKQNFSLLTSYFETVMCLPSYRLKTDYTIRTLLYNFVASVKAYLNRKRKRIDSEVPSEYKNGIYAIFQKYWKSGRETTAVDKVVVIRDKFEHEKIDGFKLTRAFGEDRIETKLIYEIGEMNLLKLCRNAIEELDQMNLEIDSFVAASLDKLNLRHNSLFLNAFYCRFHGKIYTQLLPEEEAWEINYYDQLINALYNEE